MEPVAEFLEDVFILGYAWRYWIAVGAAALTGVVAMLPLYRVRVSPRRQKAPAGLPGYGAPLRS